MVESAILLLGWAAGCWYVSGAFAQLSSMRLICGSILTMAIGLALALLGLLYGPACWALLVLAIALSVRARRRSRRRRRPKLDAYWPYIAIVAAVAFIAWPAVVRPPTDGDTLIYHLPLAASWVHSHSIWNTDTQYWWYPGGSELVDAVLISACGAFAIPFVGAVALLTLAVTTYEAALSVCRQHLLSATCALALATSHVAAIQGGDLQNDVFLAALFLALVFARIRGSASWPMSTALAITKPSGWVYSLATSLFTGKHRLRSGLLVLVTLGFWWVRNAVLVRASVDPMPSRFDGGLFATSIVAHGMDGVVTLGRSAVNDGWSTALFILFAFGSIAGVRSSGYARLAFVAAMIWIASPYTFESGGIAQLAVGSALRFGLPAMACATIAMAQFARYSDERLPGILRTAGSLLAALAVVNLYRYEAIYRFDHSADFMPWVAGIAIVTGLLILVLRNVPRAGRIAIATAATASLLILGARDREQANVDGYYSAMLNERNVQGSLPTLLEQTGATTIATYGFEPGIAVVVRPDARVIEMPAGTDACAFASSIHGVVLIHAAERPSFDFRCTTSHPNSQDFEVFRPSDLSRRLSRDERAQEIDGHRPVTVKRIE